MHRTIKYPFRLGKYRLEQDSVDFERQILLLTAHTTSYKNAILAGNESRALAESGATTGPESTGTDTEAVEFGAALRDVRQGKNLELYDIAKTLRIREDYLKGIENGQFDSLPGPTYANGFVRAYADYLGLEIDEVMRRYKLAIASKPSNPTLTNLSPSAEARLPGGLVLMVALVLAVSTYGVWYYFMVRDQSSTETISALPETMTNSAGLNEKTNKEFVAPNVGLSSEKSERLKNRLSIAKKTTSPNHAIKPHKVTIPNLHVKAHKTSQLKTEVPSLKKLGEKRLTATAQSKNLSSEKKVISGRLKNISRIVLRANEDSWVEVKEVGGKRLISKILREGDSYQVPLSAGIKLSTGNAGGVDILVDGKKIASLGPVGAVRRNILLDPDILLARSPGQR